MSQDPPIVARCHCGQVQIRLSAPPAVVVDCNCSLCRAYGARWTYPDADEIEIVGDPATDTYAWNGKHVDFHRCRTCGCVTHWLPRDASRTMRGVNVRHLPDAALAGARIRHRDGAGSGDYLD